MNAPDRYERFVVPEGIKKTSSLADWTLDELVMSEIYHRFFGVLIPYYFFCGEKKLGFRMRGTPRSSMRPPSLLSAKITRSETSSECPHTLPSAALLFSFSENQKKVVFHGILFRF
ncbi:unnamed protein product [Musa hybrid cultivar]